MRFKAPGIWGPPPSEIPRSRPPRATDGVILSAVLTWRPRFAQRLFRPTDVIEGQRRDPPEHNFCYIPAYRKDVEREQYP